MSDDKKNNQKLQKSANQSTWRAKSDIPWEKTDCSPSRVAKYEMCPANYAYYYLQRLRSGDKDFFFMGNVLDEIAFEEFRFDMSQNVDDIVQLAGDEYYARMTSSETLTNFKGEKFTEQEILDSTMNFRTWVRGFLEALQNGEDNTGRKVHLPVVADTQVEAFWTLNIDGQEVRMRGFSDILHEDGSVTDIKMASPIAQVIWTEGKIMSELQWVFYSQGLNTNKFRYLVLDKKKSRNGVAQPPEVRVLPVNVYPSDVENVKNRITLFLRGSDFLNGHKNGVFPAKPLYNGVANKFGGRPKDLQLTQNNFCQHLCDYKEMCFKEHFSGDKRFTEPDEE
tara:strand:- start:5408 stop:6418 length:1011 start_codon:yes stop_codon:yes gene_type:complete